MRVACGFSTIEVRRFTEKADLLRHLHTKEGFTLHESADDERLFYSVSISPSLLNQGSGEAVIGLCTEDQGITPEILSLPEKRLLLIGFNSKVLIVDCESAQVRLEQQLPSLFWSFAQVLAKKLILVFYEIGVSALDDTGLKIWDYSRELVTSATLEGETLTLFFFDTSPVTLEVSTGRMLTTVRPA